MAAGLNSATRAGPSSKREDYGKGRLQSTVRPVRATAVIGANFGDEGKGLLTDYLAAKDPAGTVVIRCNGGAQAGHTVVTPAGRRHVFHHLGSGSLAGAST